MVTVIPKTAAESPTYVVRNPSGMTFATGISAEQNAAIEKAGPVGSRQRLDAINRMLDRPSREVIFCAYLPAKCSRLCDFFPAMVGIWFSISHSEMARGAEADKRIGQYS